MHDHHTAQRRRRILMQLIMWLALGGTVGLAAAVNQWVARPQRIEVEGVQIQLPRQWRIVSSDDPRLLIIVVDASTQRTLAVTRQLVDPDVGVYPYLLQSGWLSPDYHQARQAEIHERLPLRIAGQEGLVIVGVRQLGGRVPRKDLLASVIMPDGQAVTIIMQGLGHPTPTDLAQLQQIADTLIVSPRS